MEASSFRIAHISDLHFSKFTLNPAQFFSKRWIGNFNLLLSRQKDYETNNLHSLVSLFKNLQIKYVIISGDLTTTSLKHEFQQATVFLKSLQEAGIRAFSLPGNHDHYTQKTYQKKTFYEFFSPFYEDAGVEPLHSFNLKTHGITARALSQNWWLIGLDTAKATSLFSSRGVFSKEIEENLEKLLNIIPSQHRVILANHFPFFNQESTRKVLMRSTNLKKQLERFSKVKLYLHGHTHRHSVADLRSNNLPIVLDSGSTSNRQAGTWNLIDISQHGCEVQVFRHHPQLETHPSGWQSSAIHFFNW